VARHYERFNPTSIALGKLTLTEYAAAGPLAS
jgi:hypothetical protein